MAGFLGTGWAFPVDLAPETLQDGSIVQHVHHVEGELKIRQAIEIILRTAPGERPMRPTFGCGIHDLVFDTVSDEMLGRVAAAVSTALATWEPRIDVDAVDAREDPNDPTRLLIEIDYRVRSTNSRFNLVFPFYVQ